MLTGHGGFSDYLYRFKVKDNPSCIYASNVPETLAHILFTCPITELKRLELALEIEIDVTAENASTMIQDKNKRDKIIRYGKKIVTKIITRNK